MYELLYKFQYSTHSEKDELISMHSEKHLIEEQNITEGNFLVFSDEPLPEKVVYTQVPQDELNQYKKRITDLELTIAEMMTF